MAKIDFTTPEALYYFDRSGNPTGCVSNVESYNDPREVTYFIEIGEPLPTLQPKRRGSFTHRNPENVRREWAIRNGTRMSPAKQTQYAELYG